jgi:hypothetical protein
MVASNSIISPLMRLKVWLKVDHLSPISDLFFFAFTPQGVSKKVPVRAWGPGLKQEIALVNLVPRSLTGQNIFAYSEQLNPGLLLSPKSECQKYWYYYNSIETP